MESKDIIAHAYNGIKHENSVPDGKITENKLSDEVKQKLNRVSNVNSVNGIEPDTSGDVQVPAVYHTEQTLSNEQKQQARENIGAADDTVMAAIAQQVTNVMPTVMGRAITELYDRINGIEAALHDLGRVTMEQANFRNIPTVEGAPMILLCSGAPSATDKPVNWNEETMGAWDGVPSYAGQLYIDTSTGTLYVAKANTAVGDWKQQ